MATSEALPPSSSNFSSGGGLLSPSSGFDLYRVSGERPSSAYSSILCCKVSERGLSAGRTAAMVLTFWSLAIVANAVPSFWAPAGLNLSGLPRPTTASRRAGEPFGSAITADDPGLPLNSCSAMRSLSAPSSAESTAACPASRTSSESSAASQKRSTSRSPDQAEASVSLGSMLTLLSGMGSSTAVGIALPAIDAASERTHLDFRFPMGPSCLDPAKVAEGF
mmetsp:Transcript_97006/g.171749  ORF Transcript_97006/g.171749 Transcript_97006/m.171749 type:complete len:222 (+) Transcript_97006:1070-1735(+)